MLVVVSETNLSLLCVQFETIFFKGRVYCFSMRSPKPWKKIFCRSVLSFSRKTKQTQL